MASPEYPFDSDYENPEFKPYLVAIGKLATTWAMFEFTLNDIIWELANLSPKAGTCLTAQLIGPGPRFRCLVALLTLRGSSPRVIKIANSISSKADDLGRQRNRYVHGPAVFRSTDNISYRGNDGRQKGKAWYFSDKHSSYRRTHQQDRRFAKGHGSTSH
jgi:hypothetical protein